MTNEVKFTHITRVIDPKTRIHYLDAIDEDGKHWMAQMTHQKEEWLTYDRSWHKDPQQPFDTL